MALVAQAGSNATATVNVTLTGVGGNEYGYGSNWANGEYVMPYYVSINHSAPMAVICDDYSHSVTVGEQWVGAIHTFSNLNGTRFGTADATQYHEAAWIASQITSTSSLVNISAAQFAIWKLFTNNTPTVAGEAVWLSAAATAAANNYYGMDFSHWEILTPLNPTSPQEYLFYVSSIPEPSALIDLSVGLTLLVGLWTAKGRRLVP
jgi:hypothetical protein